MYIRVERIRNSESVLLIDEVGKYIGQIEELEFFMQCVDEKLDVLEEGGYIFFHVNKECLNELL